MKRDEVQGPAVPAPAAALPGRAGIGNDGEGEAVSTALRRDDTDGAARAPEPRHHATADASGGGATPDAQHEQRGPDRHTDTDAGTDAGTDTTAIDLADGAAGPVVEPRRSVAGDTDGAGDGADEATGLVPEVPRAEAGASVFEADDPQTAAQPAVDRDADDADPAARTDVSDHTDAATDQAARDTDTAVVATEVTDITEVTTFVDRDATASAADETRDIASDPEGTAFIATADPDRDLVDPDGPTRTAVPGATDDGGTDDGGTRTIATGGSRSGFDEVSGSYVVQDGPAEMSPSELRIDFGAHLEANYQRLVAQLYAITLSADQAHSVVQDAYSRAWRNWAIIGRSADPTGWVRRVAVRTTTRSWRHLLARLGLVRAAPPVAEGLDERTTELLTALRQLSAPERRSVVLFHMAGLSTTEIAAVEQVSPTTVSTRLDRARRTVLGDTNDLLTGLVEMPPGRLGDDRGYVDEMSLPPAEGERTTGVAAHLDDRWERSDAWDGGPDGSWPASAAPPWEAPDADPWPAAGNRTDDAWEGDPREGTERFSLDGDAPFGRAGRNDPPDADDDRSWGGEPAQNAGVLLDEFDTVAPDGTVVVAAAENPSRAGYDGPVGSGARPGAGDTDTEHRTEGDSEDRR